MRLCFLVTSVIDITSKPLTYSSVRSIYSSEERYLQTLETIKSIRRQFKSSKITLIESGHTDYGERFIGYVDSYYFNKETLVKRKLINSKNKGIGEVYQILTALQVFDYSCFDLIVKISGRYKLSDQFSIRNHNFNSFNFKVNKSDLFHKSFFKKRLLEKTLTTVLYSVPSKEIPFLRIVLLISLVLQFFGFPIESAMALIMPKRKINALKRLFVEGNISVDGMYGQW